MKAVGRGSLDGVGERDGSYRQHRGTGTGVETKGFFGNQGQGLPSLRERASIKEYPLSTFSVPTIR